MVFTVPSSVYAQDPAQPKSTFEGEVEKRLSEHLQKENCGQECYLNAAKFTLDEYAVAYVMDLCADDSRSSGFKSERQKLFGSNFVDPTLDREEKSKRVGWCLEGLVQKNENLEANEILFIHELVQAALELQEGREALQDEGRFCMSDDQNCSKKKPTDKEMEELAKQAKEKFMNRTSNIQHNSEGMVEDRSNPYMTAKIGKTKALKQVDKNPQEAPERSEKGQLVHVEKSERSRIEREYQDALKEINQDYEEDLKKVIVQQREELEKELPEETKKLVEFSRGYSSPEENRSPSSASGEIQKVYRYIPMKYYRILSIKDPDERREAADIAYPKQQAEEAKKD